MTPLERIAVGAAAYREVVTGEICSRTLRLVLGRQGAKFIRVALDGVPSTDAAILLISVDGVIAINS